MKYTVAFIIIIMIFSASASAYAASDPYAEGYELSGAAELEGELPREAAELLREAGIEPENSSWGSSLSVSRVLSHLLSLLSGKAAAPLSAGGGLLGLIILSAAFPAVSDGKRNGGIPLVTVLCTALCVAAPVWKSIYAAVGAIKSCSEFMLAFVPVFAGIAAISGSSISIAPSSAVLLAAAEGVGAAAAFIIIPLMGAQLAMSLCSAVSPLSVGNGLAEGIRKAAMWLFSLITTVFLGILGIQNAVNSAADTVALKTGRFILGTAVPIAGAALSEAAATVAASLSLLRASVGIYGIAALSAILLPIIVDILLWRAVLLLCASAARQFSLAAVDSVLSAIEQMLALLFGIIMLVAAMLIIALSVTVSARGAI